MRNEYSNPVYEMKVQDIWDTIDEMSPEELKEECEFRHIYHRSLPDMRFALFDAMLWDEPELKPWEEDRDQ